MFSFKSPINGALVAPPVSHPGVNAWATENRTMKLAIIVERTVERTARINLLLLESFWQRRSRPQVKNRNTRREI
jgi:hypothetical protein